ncbi:MAG: choice-of-anchor J domain-containing protein [Burkholderiaceae bacterium]
MRILIRHGGIVVKPKQLALALATGALFMSGSIAHSATMPVYTQDFEGFPLGAGVSVCTPASGLCYVNRSTLPAANWGGGNTNIFAAQSGTPSSYLADSFEAGGGTGIVSDWLLTPMLTIGNGYTFSFSARADADTQTFPDRLQALLSTSGASVNVGTTPTGLGVFSLISAASVINPLLAPGGFPTTWTSYAFTVSGLTGTTIGRFALRYFLDDDATQGSYIGVDNLVVTAVPEPRSMLLMGLGLSAMALTLRRKKRK